MKEIPLTRGKTTLVDDDDYKMLCRYDWYAKVGHNTFYAARTFGTKKQKNQKTLRMHRVITECPDEYEVDHIDGNGLNNQRSNLRIVTRRENQQNLHIKKTSKFPGVTLIKSTGRWQAQMKRNGIKSYLGHFLTEELAYERYVQELAKVK